MTKKQAEKLTGSILRSAVICVLMYFAAASVLYAQYAPFRFEKFGVDNGLSNQIVTCALRDSTGYLWVGTENGLNRFDGYGFKHFLPGANNKNGLQDGSITTLFEDSRGNLWIGTKTGGLHLFDRRAETFYAFRHDPKNQNGLSDNRVHRIYEDKDGSLWIGTSGGLDKAVRAEGVAADSIHFTSFRNDPNNPESLSNNRVGAVARDSAGNLWVGTKQGLNRMISESPARFERFTHDKNKPDSLPDDEVYSLLPDSEGNLWIGLWGGGGLSRINASDLSKPQPIFQRFPYDEKTKTGLEFDITVNLSEDAQGNIWLANGDHERLTYLSRSEKNKPEPRFVSFANDEGNPFSLGRGPVYSVTEDKQGILWVAASTGGLNKLDSSKAGFKIYRHNPNNANPSLPENNVGHVVEDTDGSIWIGSEKGITQIIPAAEAFSQPTYNFYKTGAGVKDGLRSQGIETLLLDSKGRLWAGTIGGGLKLREKKNDKVFFSSFEKDEKNPQSLGNNTVLTLLEDSRGNIWVGTYQGLYKMVEPTPENPQTTFIAYRSKKGDAGTLSSDIIESLAEGADGSIWVGTVYGLNRLDAGTGKITRYTAEAGNQSVLGNEFINNLFQSANGALWIGTRKGLYKFDAGTQTFSRLAPETGFADLSISAMAEDSRGYLWVATNNGLFRYDPQKNASRHFGKNDGLPGELFNRNAAFRGKNGTLYFGGAQGLIAFDPQDVKDNAFAPPVVLTEFFLANQAQPILADSILPAHIQTLEKIVLNYTDNIFGIEFSALNYKQPEDNRFAYKMEGLSDDWIETDGKNRRAMFTNLNTGEYVFRVKAANNDGVWNENGAALRVVVLPPWWKTWWAQTLFYSLVIVGILAVPFIRLSRLKKQRASLEKQVAARTSELSETNQKLEEANRAKSVFLSNMSHELRTPLNAVIGFSQLLGRDSRLTQEQSESLGVIHRSGEHLLGLINDVLSISKIEAGKLVLTEQVFDPRKMLRSVEEMLRMRADAKNLTLLFEVEPDIPKLVKGDENKLRQVLINLLGNAVKFTESGGVVLRCGWSREHDDGRARFEVEDTGFGIAEEEIGNLFEAFVQTESGRRAKEGTGLGLVISRQIVELMGGEIKVKSRLNEGTVFSFEVNLPPASESEKPSEKCRVVGLASDEQKRRILVVDDTPENRMLLTKLLSSVGFEVREASNGQEALDKWSEWQPHLIFMDLRMPVMDGCEATRKIRAAEAKSNGEGATAESWRAKIVALTASAFESERGTVIQQGADDFLAKPFRHETIFENLTKHLGVRFRYENEENSSVPTEIVSNADFANLTPERFAAVMKPELLAQFEHALRAGDDLTALRVTDELRSIDAALAATIQHAVKGFDFDLVLRAMGKD